MPLVPLLHRAAYVPGPKSLGQCDVTVSLQTGTPTLGNGRPTTVSLGVVAATVSVATEYPGLAPQPQRLTAAVTIAVCDQTPALTARRVPPSMRANVTVRVATRFPQLGRAGRELPAGGGTWTIPDATPPDILSMRFTVGAQRLENARIQACDIGLSDRAGYESCTISYALKRPGELNPAWHTRLLVRYKDTDIFRGRLEESTCEVADDLTRTLVFTGPICRLDDHQAYRRVFVDSDLENWNTDQGPQTQANVWEVSAT